MLRHRNFALLWAAGLVSNAGDWALAIALPVYVYDLTGSTFATGAMLLAQSLPRLLFGLVAGALADRWDRRRAMIAADLGRAAVLPFLLLVDSPETLPLLYAVAACEAMLALLYAPAQAGLLPRLVGEERLPEANGLRAVGWELARLAAPPVAGLLMAAYGLPAVVFLDGISFLVSAALLGLIQVPEGTVAEADDRDSPRGVVALGSTRRDLLAGLILVRRDRLLLLLLGVGGLCMLGEGIVNVLGFPWLAQVLGGGAAERGWMATAQALGGIAGGLAIRGIGRASATGRAVGVGCILFGVASLVLTNIGALPVGDRYVWPLALLLRGLSGAPLVALTVGLETLLMRGADDRFRGRVVAAYGATNGLALVAGQGLAGVLGDRLGVVPVLSLQGVLYLAAGMAALALLPRYVRRGHRDRRSIAAPATAGAEGGG